MNKQEYLEWLKLRLERGEITKEIYEHGVKHADVFSNNKEDN